MSQPPRTLLAAAVEPFDTPFVRLASTARSWQLAFFTALAAIVILVVGLVQLSVHRRVAVHVVEVDPLGRTVYAGEARELRDPEPLVRYELSEFIVDLRTVVSDRRALFHNRKRALVHASAPVRAVLDAYFADPANDPRRLGTLTFRSVHVSSILPLSETSWQIQWTEMSYARSSGRLMEQTSWTAVLEVDLPKRKRSRVSDRNPLGLIVTNLTWAQTAQVEGESR